MKPSLDWLHRQITMRVVRLLATNRKPLASLGVRQLPIPWAGTRFCPAQESWCRERRDQMHRWNLLVLVALLAAILITLSGPSGAMAASPSTFKGKASVYDRSTPAYFVVNFTCTNGTLSGNWTWQNSLKVSYSGTLGPPSASCALNPNGPPWSSSMGTIALVPQTGSTGATLTLAFSHITQTKTYVSNTTTYSTPSNTSGCVDNPSTPPCIVIQTNGLGAAVGSKSPETDFNSNPSPAPSPVPYGTLNLTLP
jgi:hypothetical protein